MKKREIGGLILFLIGLILSFMGIFSLGEGRIAFFIYGIPLVIISLAILLNKNEDKIEKINYKGGKNNDKK